MTTPASVTAALRAQLERAIAQAGGWLGFDRFMALALYAPGLGYYANGTRKFGALPSSGSDFVTAPELSPLFGQTLAAQVAQALAVSGTDEIWEFGAGSGALARQLLDALGEAARRYTIVELSGSLRARQQQVLRAHADKARWADELPARMQGVVLGNEVLDAMPVRLLLRRGGLWHERGVVWAGGGPAWGERPTTLRPPVAIGGEGVGGGGEEGSGEEDGGGDYLTEIHPQAEAFMRTLAERLARGAAFFIDYGFGEREYYHPQRHMGTLMCHRAHRADADPLADLGLKDITAHVNFTGIALAAQEAGLEVLGYTSQARFLLNCGLAQRMAQAPLPERARAHRLLAEHEMGELFKVIGLAAGAPWDALGFRQGDRAHRL